MSYDFPATITFQERTTDWHYFIDCDKLKWSGQGATLEDAKERALATVERLKVTGEITYVYKEKLIAEDKKRFVGRAVTITPDQFIKNKEDEK